MPRMSRLEVPGALHHIMAHSVSNKDMFRDDDDRKEFLKRLTKGLKKTEFDCYTWTLMDNHYHMLIRVNERKLEKLMRGLNGGYAQYYNKKYGMKGYVFQDRFKSVPCQDLDYAEQLIRYINLNPLRAGKVKSFAELEAYTWCGHGYLLGQKGAFGEEFQNREECLRRFGEEEKQAIENYKKFLKENYVESNAQEAGKLPFIESTELVNSCKGLPAVIGNPDFVKRAREQYRDVMNRKHRKVDHPKILEDAAELTCRNYNLNISELFKRGWSNTRTLARIHFCHHLYRNELIPPSVIARYLKITISPVTRMIDIGDALEREGKLCKLK